MITFHEVQPHESEFQVTLLEYFSLIFPNYRRYQTQIQRSMELGEVLNEHVLPHHWLILKHDKAIGFILFNYLIKRNFGFVRYIGIDPAHRGAGVTQLTAQNVLHQIALDAQKYNNPVPIGFCAEIESPEQADDKQEVLYRQRLLNFFFRACGAFELGVDYIEPPMIKNSFDSDGHDLTEATPMHLLVFPTDAAFVIDASITQDIVEGIYFDHYCLDSEDAIVRSVIRTIR